MQKTSNFETIAIFGVLGIAAIALVAMQFDVISFGDTAPAGSDEIVVAGEGEEALASAIASAARADGSGLAKLLVNDVIEGSGEAAVSGDTVVVHYEGQLQGGVQFDSSFDRGVPFTFTLGEGKVIAGWERGIEGMKVGGERILVIPPHLGYGEAGVGQIPGNATLVFRVVLEEIQ